MVCKVGMSLYCIQILHAKRGSFENNNEKKKQQKKEVVWGFFGLVFVLVWFYIGFFFPLVAFVETKGWNVVVTHTHSPTQLHRKESGNFFFFFFFGVLLNLIR